MNYLKKLLHVAGAVAVLCSGTLFAGERRDLDVLQLETFVVKSSSMPEDKNNIQQIDTRALRAHKVVDLAEILADELVEVQMIRKSGYGNEVSMRGFGQAEIKVMLDDGILEGACGSRKDPSLSHINMLTVKDIIIQQGPFDVSKAGCLGGYVNVVTKKPESGYSGELLGKAGSFGFYSTGFTANAGSDKIQALVGYNYSESGQYKDGAGNELWTVRENTDASYNQKGRNAKSFAKHDVWGKFQVTPNDQHTILVEHTYGKALDVLTPRVAFDTEKEITNLTKVSWEMFELGEWFEDLTLSFYQNAVEHYPFQDFRQVAVPKNNKVKSVITGGNIENITTTDFANFSYGVNLYHRDWWGDVFSSRTGAKLNDFLIPSVKTVDVGGYIQADKTFDAWSVGVGVRYDYFQQKADEELVFTSGVTDENRQVDHLVGGHVSLKYFCTQNSTFFGGVGRSYRTPTSIERYIQGSPGFFGNPNLKPTANTEIDFGYKHEQDYWWFQVKGFYSDLKDYIYQENNLNKYKSFTNIDAHIYGVDMKANTELFYGFSLWGGIALQRGRKDSYPDNNRDPDLGQIAPLKSKLALNYNDADLLNATASGFFGTIEWIHSNAAEYIDEQAGEQHLGAWDVMNLRFGYQFDSVWTLTAGVDNVFDCRYAVANSYEWDVLGGVGANPAVVNEPGRFFYSSISGKF